MISGIILGDRNWKLFFEVWFSLPIAESNTFHSALFTSGLSLYKPLQSSAYIIKSNTFHTERHVGFVMERKANIIEEKQ